ncbi:MAG: histidine phosphatase family protein, partial [Gammaproteobacteria bacterium]|nr:histidine phosphatase family protein [Gammaproteobacteria bacterium]
HAKSDWDSGSATDFGRPLNQRGRSDAPRIGHWMKGEGLQPDYILSSPAQRARETVLAVCAELGQGEQQVHWEPRIYEASVDTLLQLLEALPAEATRILLVGHNPGLEGLVYLLSGDGVPLNERGKGLTTANLVQLEIPAAQESLGRRCAQLRQLVRPSDC